MAERYGVDSTSSCAFPHHPQHDPHPQLPINFLHGQRAHTRHSLRQHEPELRAAGLLRLRLFGSLARGDNTPGSDVDLLFDFDESQTYNVLRIYGFEDRITEMIGIKTHISSAKYLKPKIRERIFREAIRVF